jgi:DNA-directed RNA polymerase subunit RPC12/RpoP
MGEGRQKEQQYNTEYGQGSEIIDSRHVAEKKEQKNKRIEIIEVTKEYLDQHPETMDQLVLCYRDIFGHKGIKKENAEIIEWGEYLRCRDCHKGISIEEVFLDTGDKSLVELDETDVLETTQCPHCRGRVEFWHDPKTVKAMIESFLNEDINREIEDLSKEEKKKKYKYSYAVLLKQIDEMNKEEIVGFVMGTTRFKDKALEDLQYHVRTGSGREVRADKTGYELRDEEELEQLKIIKGFDEDTAIPNYEDIKNLMYVAEMGLVKKARSSKNVKELTQRFFKDFTQKLKEKGINCHDILQWTAKKSRIYNILMGLDGKEVYRFEYGDLVVICNNLDMVNKILQESPQTVGRRIIKVMRADALET